MTKTKQPKVVTINSLQVQRMHVAIVGISSLIVNRFSQKALGDIANKQNKTGENVKSRAARNPVADYEGCFYTGPKNELLFPTAPFKASLLSAADKDMGLPKTKVGKACFIYGDRIRIYGTPQPLTSPCRLKSGTFSINYRPEFPEWAMEFDVDFRAPLNEEQILNLFAMAGWSCGIGDWRPDSRESKTGTHGRYRLCNLTDPEDKALFERLKKAPQSHLAPPDWVPITEPEELAEVSDE